MITMGNYNRKEVVRDKFRYKNKQIYSQTKKKQKIVHHFFLVASEQAILQQLVKQLPLFNETVLSLQQNAPQQQLCYDSDTHNSPKNRP